MVNKMKYIIEMECNVEGDENRLREVASQAKEGVDLNVSDLEGVGNVSISIKAKRIVEEDIDLTEEDTPQI